MPIQVTSELSVKDERLSERLTAVECVCEELRTGVMLSIGRDFLEKKLRRAQTFGLQ